VEAKPSRLDWHSLDRAALDAAYNNGAAVANSGSIVAAWEARSAELRLRDSAMLDLAYGPRPRNRIDFIKCATPRAPTLAFVHGGYWQMRAKESFSFLATGPLAIGMNVAFVGYTLAPTAAMDEIVGEVRRALDWLAGAVARARGRCGQAPDLGMVGRRPPCGHDHGSSVGSRLSRDQRHL
jgi:arylformamidase